MPWSTFCVIWIRYAVLPTTAMLSIAGKVLPVGCKYLSPGGTVLSSATLLKRQLGKAGKSNSATSAPSWPFVPLAGHSLQHGDGTIV